MTNRLASSPVQTAIAQATRLFADVLNNQRRQARIPEYVQLNLPVTLPAVPEPRNFIQQRVLGRAPMSLWELGKIFDRVAVDTRLTGIILGFRALNDMPLSDIEALRQNILRLRQRGKRVVAYAQDYDLRMYYAASACDEILLQPSGGLRVTGLTLEQLYLKETLATLGIAFDTVAISPYKSATERFMRTEPSEEVTAMTNWLLDSNYQTLIAGIAQARAISHEAVHTLIDEAIWTDLKALEAGYVDGICNEEGLAAHLKVPAIALWEEAHNQVVIVPPGLGERFIAVITASGVIMPGESNRPPVDLPLPLVGGPRLGDVTLVRQVRNLMKEPRLAAVVLYIDSPGGSAAASEAMASALDELSKRVPVVACMGSVAASGGYYIATPADYIIAQPATITGSIGVITAKPVTDGLYKRLKLHPHRYQRGRNASIDNGHEPWTDDQRAKVADSIERIYDQFLGRVADARKMKVAEVDAIGGGRVWTGAQALENGLVDRLGGLMDAIDQARNMAKLPENAPVRFVFGPGKPLAAQLAERADPAASVRYVQHMVEGVASGAPQCLMPYQFRQ